MISSAAAAEFLRIHLFAQRHGADQMMRRFRQGRLIWLRRQQIESAINLKRIRADDFGADLPRDFRSELGFPGRGRPDDEENALHI